MAGVLGFEPRMSIPKTDALPLGHTPTFISAVIKKWCRNQDSNTGPDDYKSTALPTELLRRTI